jgi:SNF2 family DNA or RNA helicase
MCVFNQIGTGKTKAMLWAADYLMKLKLVKKVLILSPLSTLERVWGDEIYQTFTDRKFVVLHGTADKRKKLLNSHADYYIINHDGFSIIADHAIGMFDLIIVDEAAVYRNPSSARFKVFRKFMTVNPQARLWLATGTPTPNEPTDAWTLAKLIDSPHIPKSYTAFKDQVMMRVGNWKWIPRPEAGDIVKHVLQPAVRFTRDECLDLPPTLIQTRQVELTPDQKLHYKQMLRQLSTEVAGSTLTAVNEGVKVQKLVQILCGVAYDKCKNYVEIDASPRVNLVKDIIDEAGEKVIVFLPLTGALRMLEKALMSHTSVAVVNGETSAGKRNEIFNMFQNEEHPRVLIAHPKTMAHGLTLTSASTIIWYGPINSAEDYEQANGRITRQSQTNITNIIHIAGTDLERKMYDRLAGKQKMQGLLLDLIQQEINKR